MSLKEDLKEKLNSVNLPKRRKRKKRYAVYQSPPKDERPFFGSERKSERRESWKRFRQDVGYNLANSSFKEKVRAFSKLVVLLLIMVGIPIILVIVAKDTLMNREYLSALPQRLAEHRNIAFIVLVLLQTAQIVCSFLPGQPIQFASSYLYGLIGGYIITILGAVIGCVITYLLADFLGRDALHLLFGQERVNDYVEKLNSGRAYTIILLIYLIPGIPKDMVSYVAGISDIKLGPFLVVSTIGRTPGVIESLLVGIFLAEKNYVGVGIVALVALVILVVCVKYREKIMDFIDSVQKK